MKVKDLIAVLEDLDSNQSVILPGGGGGYVPVEGIETREVRRRSGSGIDPIADAHNVSHGCGIGTSFVGAVVVRDQTDSLTNEEAMDLLESMRNKQQAEKRLQDEGKINPKTVRTDDGDGDGIVYSVQTIDTITGQPYDKRLKELLKD